MSLLPDGSRPTLPTSLRGLGAAWRSRSPNRSNAGLGHLRPILPRPPPPPPSPSPPPPPPPPRPKAALRQSAEQSAKRPMQSMTHAAHRAARQVLWHAQDCWQVRVQGWVSPQAYGAVPQPRMHSTRHRESHPSSPACARSLLPPVRRPLLSRHVRHRRRLAVRPPRCGSGAAAAL